LWVCLLLVLKLTEINKEVFDFIWRNATTKVLNRELELDVALRGLVIKISETTALVRFLHLEYFQVNNHFAVGLTKFERVRKQVNNDLEEARLVAVRRLQVLLILMVLQGDLTDELNVFVLGCVLHHSDGSVYH